MRLFFFQQQMTFHPQAFSEQIKVDDRLIMQIYFDIYLCFFYDTQHLQTVWHKCKG